MYLVRRIPRQLLPNVQLLRSFATDAPPETMEFPGGSVPYTSKLGFLGGSTSAPRIPCYRTIDLTGADVSEADVPYPVDQELGLKLYVTMVKLQTMDTLFYEAQRQGRFAFYMTSSGEESTVVGAAAGLSPDDLIFAQYREQGALLWRGFTIHEFADQAYGNRNEPSKGRQMPMHYGSKVLNYPTISSPLATQMPHAVGAAYALKLDHSPAIAMTFFGEGAASEGDAHAAFNFAATLGAPCLFLCRNNGYAISTPASEQYRSDGIAGRAEGYGMPVIRVDGGDVRAVYNAVSSARKLVVSRQGPVMVEAMSYRSGHHSTSDDSSRYRTADEMRVWRSRDPVVRWRHWLLLKGWWDETQEAALRKECRQEVMAALEEAAKTPKSPLTTMFEDVYAHMPPSLKEQAEEVMGVAARHPELLPPDVPLR